MFTTAALVFIFLSYAHVVICGSTLGAKTDCTKSYTVCSPKGASTTEPPVGSALSSIFVDIVNTVDSNKNQKRDTQQDEGALCIRASGEMVSSVTNVLRQLHHELTPLCDSYGQIVSGNYTSSDGSTANLISGNYTLADGTSGNIYGSSSSPSKPDTATLSLPTQYTASGSGTAILGTALGKKITYTTTIPGTTIPPSIVPETTAIPTIADGSTVTVVTAEAASTIQGTTIAPRTSTVTTQVAGASAKELRTY
ncbi:hypothetical protein OEA41_002769 [Lepraria neglecta]|uniref:Uncharacterized protein n=1 Tax=Lepraria neglecta TaxID=209136 RepID=A0AAD9Z5U4_9LECA|nr:hypothetical protein OEA41_002769 [Lepraria neglecta]